MSLEKSLKDDLKAIFKMNVVTLDQPSKASEQECIFVSVEEPNLIVKDTSMKGRVSGKATIFANSDKLKFGFMQKAIATADPALTKKFFFSEIEANSPTFRNIVERSFTFVYFYDEQYDPEKGEITQLDLTLTVEE